MVYQLKFIPKTYKAFQLDIMAIADKMGDDSLILKLMTAPLTGDSFAENWKSVDTTLQCLSVSATAEPDISLWDSLGLGLYLSQKAYDAIADALQHEGEFLPITVDGVPAYLFNCRSFGREDLSLTERKYLDGEPDGVVLLGFDDTDILENNRHVFRSKLQGCTALYASDKFKQLCDKHNLCGLSFDANLLDIFE